MPLNPHISDLFFNTDQKLAEVKGTKGEFLEYDRVILTESATTVLSSLKALGVSFLPSPSDLVEDFLARA